MKFSPYEEHWILRDNVCPLRFVDMLYNVLDIKIDEIAKIHHVRRCCFFVSFDTIKQADFYSARTFITPENIKNMLISHIYLKIVLS